MVLIGEVNLQRMLVMATQQYQVKIEDYLQAATMIHQLQMLILYVLLILEFQAMTLQILEI